MKNLSLWAMFSLAWLCNCLLGMWLCEIVFFSVSNSSSITPGSVIWITQVQCLALEGQGIISQSNTFGDFSAATCVSGSVSRTTTPPPRLQPPQNKLNQLPSRDTQDLIKQSEWGSEPVHNILKCWKKVQNERRSEEYRVHTQKE